MGEMINVGSLVLKTNAGMMRIVTEIRGGAPPSCFACYEGHF